MSSRVTPMYRRAPRCVFRWVRGSVLLAGPGREAVMLEGVAALSWMVLAEPGAIREVGDRIEATWSDLEGSDRSLIDDAITLLVGTGAVIVEPA